MEVSLCPKGLIVETSSIFPYLSLNWIYFFSCTHTYPGIFRRKKTDGLTLAFENLANLERLVYWLSCVMHKDGTQDVGL